MRKIFLALLICAFSWASLEDDCRVLAKAKSVEIINDFACFSVLKNHNLYEQNELSELANKFLTNCKQEKDFCFQASSFYKFHAIKKSDFLALTRARCEHYYDNCDEIFKYFHRSDFGQFSKSLASKCEQNPAYCPYFLRLKAMQEPLQTCKNEPASCEQIKLWLNRFWAFYSDDAEQEEPSEQEQQQAAKLKAQDKKIIAELNKPSNLQTSNICKDMDKECFKELKKQANSPQDVLDASAKFCEQDGTQQCDFYADFAYLWLLEPQMFQLIANSNEIFAYLAQDKNLQISANLLEKICDKGRISACLLPDAANVNKSLNKYLK